MDAVYYPVNIAGITDSQTFNDIVNSSNINGTSEFNAIKDSKDLYYSLHHVEFYKSESNSVVELCDRYDFDSNSNYGSELSDIANYIGMSAQEVGEIVPYQVVIDIPLSREEYIAYDYIEVDSYSEKVITLGSNDRVFLDICGDGKCIIQTFGPKETTLKLYNDDNLIQTFQGCGYGGNTMFCYDFGEGAYSLEVKLIGTHNIGSTKLVVTKFDYDELNDYSDIFSIDYSSFYLYSYISR